MLLKGKPVADKLFQETKDYIERHALGGRYVQFFLLADHEPSRVYLRLKCDYAAKLGLEGRITDLIHGGEKDIFRAIDQANNDPECIGIVVQLPLRADLAVLQAQILTAVAPSKDLDGLGGVAFGLSLAGVFDFCPATPKAVIELLDFYELGNVSGKTMCLIGQSNLVGKPLAVELIKRGATVASFNIESDVLLMKDIANRSDYIISATGAPHLVDQTFFRLTEGLADKVLVDVGRGIKDGKVVGDIDRAWYEDKVKAVTPVPGGLGPVTVACLFHNSTILGHHYSI